MLGAFGETILRFQLVELSFWRILAARLRQGITLDQGITKVAGWDSQSMGRLVGVLGLPNNLRAEAEQAVETRNYLAHRYIRDRAVFLDDPALCREVADELARVQARLDEFEERLDAHLRDLGVADLSEDELNDLGLLKPPSPEAWFESKGGK